MEDSPMTRGRLIAGVLGIGMMLAIGFLLSSTGPSPEEVDAVETQRNNMDAIQQAEMIVEITRPRFDNDEVARALNSVGN